MGKTKDTFKVDVLLDDGRHITGTIATLEYAKRYADGFKGGTNVVSARVLRKGKQGSEVVYQHTNKPFTGKTKT